MDVRSTASGLFARSQAAFGEARSAGWFLPVLGGLIAVFLIVIVAIAIYQNQKGQAQHLMKGPLDLFEPASNVLADRATTGKLMNGSYTLAFYIRVDAVPDPRTNGVPFLVWPGIWSADYNPAHEELIYGFGQTPDSAGASGSAAEIVRVRGVPLQRWTQVVMACEGRTIDFYINGRLVQTDTLRNLPPSAVAALSFFKGNMLGQLAFVQLWPRRLTVAEAAANYTDTSDSQGRPNVGPTLLSLINTVQIPNLFCPGGSCAGSQPTASAAQTWEFPYA
jgi:hypothetical protein